MPYFSLVQALTEQPWPMDKAKGFYGPVQKVVLELKLLHKSIEQTKKIALEQTVSYMDKCGAEEGHLLLFDRRKGKSWEEKIYRKEIEYRRRSIRVWRM